MGIKPESIVATTKKKSAVKKAAVKKTAVKKAAVKKAAVKKPAVKKSVVTKPAMKKAAAKKKAVKKIAPKAASSKIKVTPEQHHKMICEAAYFISIGRTSETVNPTEDWLKAEAAINQIYQIQ